jgi:hypothetical protein
MIATRYPIEHLPLTYRRVAYQPVLEAIRVRKSLYVTSLSGMGKTHLLRFVGYRRDLHRQAFGDEAERMAFVVLDFHGVGDPAALYPSLLAETCRQLQVPPRQPAPGATPAAVVGELVEVLLEQAPTISNCVFLFDGLEMLYADRPELEAFLRQLRLVRDNLGGAASFILGAKPPLPEVETLGGNFAYLLDDPPVLWLALLDAAEAEIMTEDLRQTQGLEFDSAQIRPLLEYVGGHARLLKECLILLSRGRISLDIVPAAWMEAIQTSSIIRRLCAQIWADLLEEDQRLLQGLARNQAPPGPLDGAIVHRVGLVGRGPDGGWRITSPLLADYAQRRKTERVRQEDRTSLAEVRLQYHELRYRALPSIRLRPKEYDIMKLLLEAEGEVVERRTLIDVAWPNEVETDVFEDNNLNTVISGLRTKLRQKGYPFQIKGIRKRGYQLLY